MVNDETLGALLLGGRPPVALPVIENAAPASSKVYGIHQPFFDTLDVRENSVQIQLSYNSFLYKLTSLFIFHIR